MQPQHVFYNFEFVSCLLLPSGVTLSFVSSSVEDDLDTKRLSKEEKGRSAWHRPQEHVWPPRWRVFGSGLSTPISASHVPVSPS